MKNSLKRTLQGFFTIVALMLMTSIFAFAQSEEYEYGDFTYKIVNGEAVITYIGSWDDVEIPSEIEGYKVTGIGEEAIDSWGFSGDIKIPSSIKNIDNKAFYGAYIYGFQVDKDNQYFSNDENGVLFNKDKTELICYPYSEELSYNVPESVKVIRDYAFSKSGELSFVELPNGLKSIGAYAFEDGNLYNITIPDSVTKIGAYAFDGCESLSEVHLGSGITVIEEGTFWCAYGLESITIPDNVKTIGKEAFYSCWDLENITIGKGVTSIGQDAFFDCDNLYDVRYCGSKVDWEKISIASGNEYLLEADIEFNYDPASAYKCGDNAFWEFDEETLTLTISGTGDMYDYEYTERGPWYKPIDKLIKFAQIKVVVEEGITSIGNYCFSEDYYGHFINCNITEISLPESLREIGIGAFQNCRYLKEITIPKNVESIGPIAFSDSSLEKVTLPEKITRIEAGTFNDTELTHIVIPDGVEYIGSQAFCDCYALHTIVLPDSVKEFDKWAFDIITYNPMLDVMGKRYLYYTGTQEQYSKIKFNVGDMGGADEYKYGKFLGDEMIYNYNTADHFHVHSFSDRVYPTCEVDGYKKFICGCGDEYKITVDALGHWFPFDNIVSVTKKASTTSDGLCSAKCGRDGCGKIDKEVLIKKIAKVKLSSTTFAYDGKNKKPTVSVYDSNNNYIDPKNYTVEYQTSCSKIGTHNLRVTFKGDRYEGSVLMKYYIVQIKQNTTQVGFAWATVNGADGYAIYQHIDGNWKLLGLRKQNNAIVSNLKPGTEYNFAVRALAVRDGKYVLAKDYAIINTATQAVKPAKIASAQNNSAIKLAWTACPGATGYRIYYMSGNTWKVTVSATAATSHTFTGLKAGAKYTFAVRPYIKTDSGVVWSDYTTYTAATLPTAPATVATSTVKGKVNVKWSGVNGAEVYQLYYKIGNGSYKLYKNYTSVQNLTFSKLTSGAKITFAVRSAKKTSGGWIFGSYNPVSVTVR